MTPWMVAHIEMTDFCSKWQNNDARIYAYSGHGIGGTTSGASPPLIIVFEYIEWAQIMCAHSRITQRDLQGVYALMRSNCQKRRTSDKMREFKSVRACVAFVSMHKLVRICKISLKGALHSSSVIHPMHSIGTWVTISPEIRVHSVM